MVVIRGFKKKKNSIVSKLSELIDYGEDLKRQIECDNGSRLDHINSMYEKWASDIKEITKKDTLSSDTRIRPFGSSITISADEILGDSQRKIARQKNEKRKNLISGVEYQLDFLSSIRSTILEGNYCNQITWRVSKYIRGILSNPNLQIILAIAGIIITIIGIIIAL